DRYLTRRGWFLDLNFQALLLDTRPLLGDDLHLQHRLAELERVLRLEWDALARRDADAVDRGEAFAGVGDAQAVLVEPDECEAIHLDRHAGAFLLAQVHVHRVRPLAADVGHTLLERIVLAG